MWGEDVEQGSSRAGKEEGWGEEAEKGEEGMGEEG